MSPRHAQKVLVRWVIEWSRTIGAMNQMAAIHAIDAQAAVDRVRQTYGANIEIHHVSKQVKRGYK